MHTKESQQMPQTPQLRYASLHRSIERGMATDEVWSELSRTCLGLGFNDEAVRAYREVEAPHLRRSLAVLLARHGLISDAEKRLNVEPSKTGAAGVQVVEGDPKPDFGQQLADSVHCLFMEHMPLTVIVATLTFPLVVGLGGFLTAGSHFFLLPAIALLPGLSVLGIVGAMGRRIMVDAGQGIYDPPRVPAFRELTQEAARFLTDMTILGLVLLGPGTTMFLLTGHLAAGISSLALGMFLMPMALLLRELSDDWRALSPMVLLRAVGRAGPSYLAVSLTILAMMLPALLSGLATVGTHLYLQIAVIGPLVVVPLFVASRLLGNFFHAHHESLQEMVGVEQVSSETSDVDDPELDNLPELDAGQGVSETRAPASPARQRLGAPSHPESQVPSRRVKRLRARNGKIVGPKPVFEEGEGKGRDRSWLNELPDLSNIPGARVVSYADRDREGASSSPN